MGPPPGVGEGRAPVDHVGQVPSVPFFLGGKTPGRAVPRGTPFLLPPGG